MLSLVCSIFLEPFYSNSPQDSIENCTLIFLSNTNNDTSPLVYYKKNHIYIYVGAIVFSSPTVDFLIKELTQTTIQL